MVSKEITDLDKIDEEFAKKEEEKKKNDKLIKTIKNHCGTWVINVKLKGPKGVRISLGPYWGGFRSYNKFTKIANLDYEENSEDKHKKHRYFIGLSEENEKMWGVASYWNVKLFDVSSCNVGLSWGAAYDFSEEKTKNAIKGIGGIFLKPKNYPVYIHIGVVYSRKDTISGYHYKNSNDEDERIYLDEDDEIPIKHEWGLRLVLSISFEMFGS